MFKYDCRNVYCTTKYDSRDGEGYPVSCLSRTASLHTVTATP